MMLSKKKALSLPTCEKVNKWWGTLDFTTLMMIHSNPKDDS
jgi:hypothetical protein